VFLSGLQLYAIAALEPVPGPLGGFVGFDGDGDDDGDGLDSLIQCPSPTNTTTATSTPMPTPSPIGNPVLNVVGCYNSGETTEHDRIDNAITSFCNNLSHKNDAMAKNHFYQQDFPFPYNGSIGTVDITISVQIKPSCE
jgi:hypothetical protein